MTEPPMCCGDAALSNYFDHLFVIYIPMDMVGLTVTLVFPAKTAEPIEMPFGLRTRVGPGNYVLDGGPDLPIARGNFEG